MTRRESDADAMAAEMWQRATREREAAEREAARRVTITEAQRRLIVAYFTEAAEFAGRFTGVKEHGVRVNAQNLERHCREVLPQLEAVAPKKPKTKPAPAKRAAGA